MDDVDLHVLLMVVVLWELLVVDAIDLLCSSFGLANMLLDQAKPGQLTFEIHSGSSVVYQWSACTPCMIHMCLQGVPPMPKRKSTTTIFIVYSNGQICSNYKVGQQYQPHPCHDCSCC